MTKDEAYLHLTSTPHRGGIYTWHFTEPTKESNLAPFQVGITGENSFSLNYGSDYLIDDSKEPLSIRLSWKKNKKRLRIKSEQVYEVIDQYMWIEFNEFLNLLSNGLIVVEDHV